MGFLGIGQIVGGILMGFSRDACGNKCAAIFQMLFFLSGIIWTFIFHMNNKFTYRAYILCFLWGLQDAGINTLIRTHLGFEFDSKIIPFCVFGFVQGIWVFIFSLIQIHVMDDDPLGDLTLAEKVDAYIITLAVFGLIGHIMMIRFEHRVKNFL